MEVSFSLQFLRSLSETSGKSGAPVSLEASLDAALAVLEDYHHISV
jgi:hypothetical protein